MNQNFTLSGEYIKLDQLLKASGAVSTGGEAKIRIADGEIFVNGEKELRRGKKLRVGDSVSCADNSFVIKIV